MKRLVFFVLCISIHLVGCRSHHVDIEENIEHKATQWWFVLGDPLMNALAQKLLEDNLTIQLAQIGYQQSVASLGIDYAAILPNVSLTGSYLNGNNQTDGVIHTEQVGMNVTWTPDAFGGLRGRYKQAYAQAYASFEAVEQAKEDTLTTLFIAVVQWRQAYERIQTIKRLIQDQDDQLALYEVKVQAGLIDASYVARARALRLETAVLLPTAETSLKNAQNTLEQLLNTTYGGLSDILHQYQGPMILPIVKNLPFQTLDSLKEYPVMKVLYGNIMVAEAQVRVARANRWPQFNMTSFFGYGSGSSILPISNPIQSIALGVLSPIIDFGSLQSAVEVAEASYVMARMSYDINLQNLFYSKDNARQEYNNGRQSVEIQQEALKFRKQAVVLLLERFSSGLTDMMDVTTAQGELNQSALTLIELKASALTAYINNVSQTY